MPEGFDPKVVLAIVATSIFSIIGAGLWLWKYKKDNREDAVRERQDEQLRDDLERNMVANEQHLEDLKKIPDEIPDVVDPADPWAGLR